MSNYPNLQSDIPPSASQPKTIFGEVSWVGWLKLQLLLTGRGVKDQPTLAAPRLATLQGHRPSCPRAELASFEEQLVSKQTEGFIL